MIRIVLTFLNIQPFGYIKKFMQLILGILLLSTISCNNQQILSPLDQDKYLMRDGVVVDLSKDTIYITNPEVQIEALDLKSGEAKWKISLSAKPLGIINERLVIQVAPKGKGNTLTLAECQTNDGKELSRTTLDLPKGASSFVRNYGKGILNIRPYRIENETILSWAYNGGITQGDYDEKRDESQEIIEGAIKVGTGPGQYDDVNIKELPKDYKLNSILVPKNQKIDTKIGQQFISKDKRHILVSWKETDDTDFNSYRWEIYDASSKKLIGKQESHVSYTPFFVKNGILYREVGPYFIPEQEGMKKVPLQILAVDFRSGKIIWSKEILDSVYRGPAPP